MARKYKKDIKVVLPHIDPFRDIAVYGAGEEMIKALGGELADKGKQSDIVPSSNNPYFKGIKKFGDGGKKQTVIHTDKALFDKAYKAEMDSINVRKKYNQDFTPGYKTRPLTKEEKEFWKDEKTGLYPNVAEYNPTSLGTAYFGHFKNPVVQNILQERKPNLESIATRPMDLSSMNVGEDYSMITPKSNKKESKLSRLSPYTSSTSQYKGEIVDSKGRKELTKQEYEEAVKKYGEGYFKAYGGYIKKYADGGVEDKEVPINAANATWLKEVTIRPLDAQLEYDRANQTFENRIPQSGMIEQSDIDPTDVLSLGAGLAKSFGKGIGKALLKSNTKKLGKSESLLTDNVDELVDLWRIQEKGGRPISELATEGKLGAMFQNEKAIKHFKDREKYYGQWFTKDKSDFDFYKADREFKNPEIINLQVPKNKLSEFQNYDKSLSRAADREFVIPFEQQKQYKKFNSEIDWSKWNKEIPKNTSLMKEYNTIEQASKTKGTWMKNPDGTSFEGTPEQFVQQSSENFKKAFPKGVNRVYRGVGPSQYNMPATNNPDFSKGFIEGDRAIFTADKELAKTYSGRKDQILTPFSDPNASGLFDLGFPKGDQINYNTMLSDFTDVNLSRGFDKTHLEYNLEAQKRILKGYKKEGKEIAGDLINNTEKRISQIQKYIEDYDKVPSNKKELKKMAQVLGDNTSTDDIAKYLPSTNLNNINLQNIIDGHLGDVTIVNSRPGNYLKSMVGNNGMFDMTNPNIYKAIAPIAIGAAGTKTLTNEKAYGGSLNNTDNMKKSNKRGQSPRSILSPEQRMAMQFGWGGGLSGGLSGAATGASIGSAIPGIGTAIGAGVGALVGGISGHLNEKKQDDMQNTSMQMPYQQPLPQQMQFAKGGMLNKRGIPHRGTSEQMPYQTQMQSYPNLEFGNGEQMLAMGGELEDTEFAKGGFLNEPAEGVIERRNKNRSREPQEYATFEENFKHMYAQGGRMGAMGPMDMSKIYYADGGEEKEGPYKTKEVKSTFEGPRNTFDIESTYVNDVDPNILAKQKEIAAKLALSRIMGAQGNTTLGLTGNINYNNAQQPMGEEDSNTMLRKNPNVTGNIGVTGSYNRGNTSLTGGLGYDPISKSTTGNIGIKKQWAEGGMLNHYNGYSHENGGIPMGPNAEVEGGETSMKMGMGGEQDSTYIYSDRLKVPGKNYTFAEASKKIDSKYGRRTNDKLSDESKKRELNKLMGTQEQERAGLVNSAYETIAAYGGPIHKYGGGGVDPVGKSSYYTGTDPVLNELMRFNAPTNANKYMMALERMHGNSDFGDYGKDAWKKADQQDLAFQNEITSQLDQETPSSPFINLNPSRKERVAANKANKLKQKMKFNPNAYLDNNTPNKSRDLSPAEIDELMAEESMAKQPMALNASPTASNKYNIPVRGITSQGSSAIPNIGGGRSTVAPDGSVTDEGIRENSMVPYLGYGMQALGLGAEAWRLRGKNAPNKAFTMERQLLNADPQLREADISASIANRNIRDLGASTSSGGAMAGYLAAQAGRTRSKADIMADLQNRQAQVDMTTGQYNAMAGERAYDKNAADAAAQQSAYSKLFGNIGQLGATMAKDYGTRQSENIATAALGTADFDYKRIKGKLVKVPKGTV